MEGETTKLELGKKQDTRIDWVEGSTTTQEIEDAVTDSIENPVPPSPSALDPDNIEGAAQTKAINEAGPMEVYSSNLTNQQYVKEADEEATNRAIFDQAAAAGEAAIQGAMAELPPADGTEELPADVDLEIPTIPGAEISLQRLAAEQRNRDQIKVDEDREAGNALLPAFIPAGISNFGKGVKALPGTAFNALMSMAQPLGAAGSFAAAPIANPSTTGDWAVDIKNDFITGFEAAKQDLTGGELEDYGTAIAENRLGLKGGIAQTVGMALNLLTDPTVGFSLPFFKTVQRGLKLKQASINSGVKAESTGNVFTNGVYELLTFGKELDPIKAAKVAKLAEVADASGSQRDIRALHDAINDMPELIDAAKQMDEADVAEDLARNVKILGDPEGPAFTADFTNVTDETMRRSLHNSEDFIPTVINTSKLNSLDDVDTLLDTLIDSHAVTFDGLVEGVSEGRRAIIEQAQVQQLSALAEKDMSHLSGRAAYAARQLLLASAMQTKSLARETKQRWSTQTDVFAFAKSAEVHKQLVERVTGKSKDAGKLYNTYEVAGLKGQDLLEEIDYAASKTKTDHELTTLLGEFLTMEKDPVIVNKILTKSRYARTADALFEVYVNALLAGSGTHVVNLVSNTALLFWKPTEVALESMSAAAFGLAGGMVGADGSRQMNLANAKFLEAAARMSGIGNGVNDVMRMIWKQDTWDDLKLDGTHFASGEISRMRLKPSITAENFEASGRLGTFIDGAGATIRFPGQALQVSDKFVKLMHYRSDLAAEAVRMASNSGGTTLEQRALAIQLRHNPTDKMTRAALDLGEYNTFTNDLGDVASDFHKLIKKVPSGRYWLPFFATPTNIVKMGMRRSLLGNVVWNKQQGAFGDLLPALSDSGPEGHAARAKIAMGTMIPMSIIAAIDDDAITGRIDTASEQGRFEAQFVRPAYSIKFGDTWYSYEKIEPLRSILGLYVNWKTAFQAIDAYDENGRPTELNEEYVAAAIYPVIQTIGDTYLLRQLGGVLGMLDDLSNPPTESKTDPKAYAKYTLKQLQKLAVSTVPFSGMGRQLNKSLDGTYRLAETWMEKLYKITPGMSEQLPARLTVWGDPQLYAHGIGPDLISVMKTETVKFDFYDKQINELGVKIPSVPKYMMVGDSGIAVSLTARQQHRLAQIRGKGQHGNRPLKDMFKAQMDSYAFVSAPKERKIIALEQLFQKSMKQAKQVLFAEDASLQEQFKENYDYRAARRKRETEEAAAGVAR